MTAKEKLEAIKNEIQTRYDKYCESVIRHYDPCVEEKAVELGKILVIMNSMPEDE